MGGFHNTIPELGYMAHAITRSMLSFNTQRQISKTILSNDVYQLPTNVFDL
jgi:hypothetical protein